MTTVLIVEDDQRLLETLVNFFTGEGYQTISASDGVDAVRLAQDCAPDLVLLDLVLPQLDGLTVCRTLRHHSQVPIMILTACANSNDRIVGLDSGADDYITKPVSFGELGAHVRALMRRAYPSSPNKLESGDLSVDLIEHRAWRNGIPLSLTPKEFDLLTELIRHKGSVLLRDQISQRVWGKAFQGNGRTVDVHIRSLREKIEAVPARPQRIETVRGSGYRFAG
jgi:DNA-binding response OmpR family regulator